MTDTKIKLFGKVGTWVLLLVLPLSIASWIGLWLEPAVVPTVSTTEQTRPVLVLDPGHGGEDGGAVAADGTMEKDLNLCISQRMAAIADLLGWDTCLTRTDDAMLYDRYGPLPTGGKKKSYDLKNRLRFAEEAGATVFCSIHMNQFPDPDCKGLQVYYSPNAADSQRYATTVQNYAKAYLDPENQRAIKKATSSIYLLHRIKTPAILIECGFLSSPTECARLQDEVYQLQLAAVVVSGLCSSVP